MADEVKKYNTAGLISFLQGQDLRLIQEDFDILENERVDGRDFFDLTQEELEQHGMKLGPAKRLVKFAKKCKDKKLRSFSSYKTKKELGEMLKKYGIISRDITRILQFIPRK